MPTYDYLCPNGHRFEVIHSLTGEGPTACPICGAAPVRKAFSAPTFHFRGSGWAKKDRSSASRSASKAASASAEGGSGSGSDGAAAAGSAMDKDKPSSGEGATSSDAKPDSGRKPASETGNAGGKTSTSGPAAD
jgi:putative FmdB family regulatory protein